MPSHRHPPGWRRLTPEALAELARALDRFQERTGRARRELARALSLAPADLSPSHLQDRALLLFWSLRREELPGLTLRLGLDLQEFRALERLSATICQVLGGYAVPEESWRDSRQEARDAGQIGSELFDRGDWGAALTHLGYAWKALSPPASQTGAADCALTLRVGTQLADWLGYAGRVREADGVVRRLLAVAREYRGSDPEVLHAMGLAYKSAATAAGHQPLTPPHLTVRRAEQARSLLAGLGVDLPAQAGALRDQAKPLALWGLGWRERAPEPARLKQALEVLEAAEKLVDGREEEEAGRKEWLLTRLTRVQCLAAFAGEDQVRRAWEETFQPEWVSSFLDQRAARPLATKVALAALALPLAAADPDRLAAGAEGFLQDPNHRDYGDRRRRVEEIGAAAARGALATACRALLG